MPQIIDTINRLGRLFENGELRSTVTVMDVLQPWMVFTGLEAHDFMHRSWTDLTEPLLRIHQKLSVLDGILGEDQAQEAACRELRDVDVLGELIEDGDFAQQSKVRIAWNGSWMWTCDPILRNRAETKSFTEARDAVLEMLKRAAAA
jgi:hypothetical protein